MSANQSPGISTFDVTAGTGPYRPGAADFNGCVKTDDLIDPPDAQTMPNAEEWNTICLLLVALGKVCPVAIFYVQTPGGGGGAGISAGSWCPSAPTFATFTYTRFSAGVYSITWPAGTFPPNIGQPTATINAGPGYAGGQITASTTTNGVTINTFNATGTAADRDFQVTVY